MSVSEESTVLSSWKDIAKYLGKGVRTVQRWEQHLGLPVRRPIGASQKSAVLLHRADVDAWLSTRFVARTVSSIEIPVRADNASEGARAALREKLQAARELREAHQKLTEGLAESIKALSERCESLKAQSTRVHQPSSEQVSASCGPNALEQHGDGSGDTHRLIELDAIATQDLELDLR